VACSFEYGNEASGFIKGGEFFAYLSDYSLPLKEPAPWLVGQSASQPASQSVSQLFS
jgi:hypothetical protein